MKYLLILIFLSHDYKGNFSVAITGLLLVTKKYGIASASDVSKVSKLHFKKDSKAMFILEDDVAWFSKLVDYITHPEYEFSTYTTIALVELDSEDSKNVLLEPICWPRHAFNTTNELYALGYTDENKLLEKLIYRMKYVNSSICDEFYNRVGFRDPLGEAKEIVCGSASNNKHHCDWDTGMVLASNSTGYWTFVGFGIHGPGCSAPARFINLGPYVPWIQAMVDRLNVPI